MTDTDNWGDWRTRPVPEGDWTMRTGRKVGRNLYIEWPDGRSEPVGQVDTAALARLIVEAVNNARSATGATVHHNQVGGDLKVQIRTERPGRRGGPL